MKKLIVFIFIAAAIVLYTSNGFVNMTAYAEGTYLFYNKSIYNSAFPKETVADGTLPFSAQLAYLKGRNLCGQTLIIENAEEEALSKLMKKLKMKTVMTQELGDIKIIYGYSNRLKNSVILDGKKVNVEIAVRGGKITAGTPLILGSY